MIKQRPYLQDRIQRNRDAALNLLADMVNINSFSHNPDGVNQVGELVKQAMPAVFQYSFETNAAGVKHHCFINKGDGRPPMVLAGHIDTLCPENASFNRLVDEGEVLRGPGVNDMKGGDVVLIQALKTLEQTGELDPLPLICIFNGDEEIGSPTSGPMFTALRGRAAAALVFECGGPADTVVTTRKGVARYRIHIRGQSSHFGNLKGAKISAIEELAHKIIAAEAMNRPDASVVTNVGRVTGGLAANAVAAEAVMDFEARYWNPGLEPEVLRQIDELAACVRVPGCQASLERLSYRPPMRPGAATLRMFDHIVARGRAMGMRIIEEKRGGVSDACWLAHAGIPVIDGLGPLGDDDFTPQEYIRKDTLFSRIELTANLLLDWRDGELTFSSSGTATERLGG